MDNIYHSAHLQPGEIGDVTGEHSTAQAISNCPLRIGILGAANIARKNIKAIQHHFNSDQCVLVAIASRSGSKVNRFIAEHIDIEKTKNFAIFAGENSYSEIINIDSIDALYIPLPTSLHYDYVKLALSAGKHVLVEKPVATSQHEYVKMIQAADSNQKYLMDGTMFVHNPRTKQIIDYLEENNIKITRIQSDFTFMGDETFFTDNIRISQNGDMLGCIGDLGWYCIRMALLAFRCQATAAQVVHYKLNDNGVPIDASCLVYFRESVEQDEKILSFHCSFLHPLTQTVTMFGKDNSISMDDFVIPREEGGEDKNLSFNVKSQSLSHADMYSLHSDERMTSTPINNTRFNPPQEVLMWNNFVKFCRGVDSDDTIAKNDGMVEINMSIQNQCIVDALMMSIQKNGEKISVASVECRCSF